MGAGIGFNFSKSKNKSQSTTTPTAAGTGLGGGILADLFGGAATLGPSGQFTLFDPAEDRDRTKRLKDSPLFDAFDKGLEGFGGFGRPKFNAAEGLAERSGFAPIRDLLSQANPFEQNFQDLIGQAVGAQQDLFGRGQEALGGLISGAGLPTDIGALARANFTDLKEQFSNLGGLFGSDLQAAQGRDVLELGVGAEEAARQRQLSALGLAQGFGQAGLDFSQNLLGAGQAFNQVGTAGGRALGLFQQLFTPQSTDPFTIGPRSQSTSTGKSKGGGASVGVSGGSGG